MAFWKSGQTQNVGQMLTIMLRSVCIATFNSYSFKKLLENVTKIRDISLLETIYFADTLDAFAIVVDDCFGNQLSEDYQAVMKTNLKIFICL